MRRICPGTFYRKICCIFKDLETPSVKLCVERQMQWHDFGCAGWQAEIDPQGIEKHSTQDRQPGGRMRSILASNNPIPNCMKLLIFSPSPQPILHSLSS